MDKQEIIEYIEGRIEVLEKDIDRLTLHTATKNEITSSDLLCKYAKKHELIVLLDEIKE